MLYLTTCYDTLKEMWSRDITSKFVALILMLLFFVALFIIGLNAMDLLPAPLTPHIPKDIFAAVRFAFSMLLLVEVISLIFIIADSTSLATGKQLEIMSLLLLREAFSDISQLDYVILLTRDWLIIVQILMASLAAVILFVVKHFFLRWHHIQSHKDMRGYINIKKCTSLVLLAIFLGLLLYDLYQTVYLGEHSLVLRAFYTILIFTDIFLVFIGQYYTPSFVATFRNSGFAVSTLLMRIALGSPHYMSALLCVFAAFYLLLLNWVLSRFGETANEGQAQKQKTR